MIKTGRIQNINVNYKEWFLGTFINEKEFNTSNTSHFEIKWSSQKKGDVFPLKEKTVEDKSCKSIAILIKGKFKYSFLKADSSFDEYLIKSEGDFIYWAPDINHKTESLEDSVILTIRWYQ